jgi:murein DD-endopeptidase MepM/ murein hydrolase activator NlpD
MRPLVELSCSCVLRRLAVITLFAVSVAACSGDVTRFNSNPFSNLFGSNNTGSTPVAAVPPAPVARVDRQPLPAQAPPANPASEAAYRASPARISSSAATQHAVPHRSGDGVHVVAAGETLSSVGRLYGKSRHAIARVNNISEDTHVRVGQKLVIPGYQAAQVAARKPAAPAKHPQVARAEPAPAAKSPATNAGLQKVASLQPMAAARTATPATETPAETEDAASAEPTGGAPNFRWPVRGRIIAGFGPKSNGQQNDGINLAVPEGTSIKAAEDGVVAYAGNELKGYGNLVLVRHGNGFVTAYAHASELMVKRGDHIRRGQIIGRAGQTGNVTSPQLHFEIRKGATPVDPSQYLAGG